MDDRCRETVLDHLDWYSRNASPLISVRVNREWAFYEAKRRREQGRTNIVVQEICISKSRLREYERCGNRIIYRHVYRWLNLARARPSDYPTYASTDQEYLFLHRIPGTFIVRTSKI